jgi:antitoxin YefM
MRPLCLTIVLGLVRAFIAWLYGTSVHNGEYMDTISVNKFRDNLKSFVEQIVSKHEPLKVTRRAGEAFVVLSAEDWAREQETLSVLQNRDLMQQIATSLETHKHDQGYKPTKEQMDEITGI